MTIRVLRPKLKQGLFEPPLSLVSDVVSPVPLDQGDRLASNAAALRRVIPAAIGLHTTVPDQGPPVP
jgi:hypothetical protein